MYTASLLPPPSILIDFGAARCGVEYLTLKTRCRDEFTGASREKYPRSTPRNCNVCLTDLLYSFLSLAQEEPLQSPLYNLSRLSNMMQPCPRLPFLFKIRKGLCFWRLFFIPCSSVACLGFTCLSLWCPTYVITT